MSVGVSVIEALANPTGKLMYDVTADDWDALRTLAEQVGCPADRVGALRKRLTATETRKGSPYVLLVGRPEGRLDLFLARCFTPEAAEAVSKAAGRPVSIGPAPGDVQP
ncbi:MAG TPA: hypothetical protein VGE52_21585, partial [Pirellulales bacterium]